MHHSKRFGYLLYPLFFFLLAAPRLHAQSTPDASAPQPQTQPEPENPQENQIRLAREAQARIQARRRQRVQKAKEDIYSHKFEVYGGGGYLRFHPGGNLEHINESAWNAGITDYLRPRLGVTADIRGYYGTAFTGNNVYSLFKPSISQYTFMAGPQYRIKEGEHWAVNAQVLAGVGKGIFNGNSANFPGTLLGLWSNGTDLVVSAGVPFDYSLSPGFAVRLMPSYLLTTYGGTAQVKNLGFTAGMIFRFGRQ